MTTTLLSPFNEAAAPYWSSESYGRTGDHITVEDAERIESQALSVASNFRTTTKAMRDFAIQVANLADRSYPVSVPQIEREARRIVEISFAGSEVADLCDSALWLCADARITMPHDVATWS